MTDIDVAALRADTPGCDGLIHFDNAGAALVPRPVHRAVVDHLELEGRVGGYRAEAEAADKLQGFYEGFARLLNCGADEIAYVENATRAWDMAFYAIPFAPGDRVLTSQSEYASNYLAFLQAARHRGLAIDVVPDDDSGQLSLDALEAMIGPRTRLIAITHVPTQGGLVNPAAEVGAIARRHGILYLLDTCQAAGQIALDVEAIGCDILSGTGRKFLRGPRGTGFLYVRRERTKELEPPFVDLHAATWTGRDSFEIRADARRFENWESYVAGRVGLAAAVDYALEIGLEAIEARVTALAGHLRARLEEIAGVSVRDLGRRRCGIVTFTKADEPADRIHARLGARGINISTSTARYARLDLEPRGLAMLARASVHYYNTEDEIGRFCAAVESGP